MAELIDQETRSLSYSCRLACPYHVLFFPPDGSREHRVFPAASELLNWVGFFSVPSHKSEMSLEWPTNVNYQNLSSAVTYVGSFLMSCLRESFIKCVQKERFPLRPHDVVSAVESLFPMLNDRPLGTRTRGRRLGERCQGAEGRCRLMRSRLNLCCTLRREYWNWKLPKDGVFKSSHLFPLPKSSIWSHIDLFPFSEHISEVSALRGLSLEKGGHLRTTVHCVYMPMQTQ